MGRYQVPKHLDLLDRLLLDLEARRLEGAIVSMPPRHGKSMLCSHFFPAWYLLWNPDHRVIFLSHNANFAKEWGRKAKDVFARYAPLFGLSIREDSHSGDHWNIAGHSGGMDTTGVGGSLTGRGAHLFIADDLVKGHREALSETFRSSAWELWQSCVETRAEPGCIFLVIATRWHQDDVSGRLLREIGAGLRPGWKVLSLPAIAGEGDALGRAPGEALWPERYPIEKLERIRTRWDHDEARLGPYWWSALYQQEPTPREGGLFKRSWFRYYTHDDEFYRLEDGRALKKSDCWCFLTCDLAVSTKTTADFFALGVWMIHPDTSTLLLHDVIHERLEGPDQGPLIARVSAERSPAFVSVEAVQYQLALVQELWRKGVPAKEVRVDKDKVARAQLAATRMVAGTVYLRRGAPWLTDLEDELVSFPNARHDDLVDMLSMAAHEAAECVIPSVS
jgi:predicted phage terminase large subunit-like protein